MAAASRGRQSLLQKQDNTKNTVVIAVCGSKTAASQPHPTEPPRYQHPSPWAPGTKAPVLLTRLPPPPSLTSDPPGSTAQGMRDTAETRSTAPVPQTPLPLPSCCQPLAYASPMLRLISNEFTISLEKMKGHYTPRRTAHSSAAHSTHLSRHDSTSQTTPPTPARPNRLCLYKRIPCCISLPPHHPPAPAFWNSSIMLGDK